MVVIKIKNGGYNIIELLLDGELTVEDPIRWDGNGLGLGQHCTKGNFFVFDNLFKSIYLTKLPKIIVTGVEGRQQTEVSHDRG